MRATSNAAAGRTASCAFAAARSTAGGSCAPSGAEQDPPRQARRRVVWECADCHEQVSLTSGTILDSTKLPLTSWFLAAFFAVTDKRGLSATLLARHLGLGSYKTAWFLFPKLRVGRW